MNNKPIVSFRDLDVYQLSRSTKAIPRLIAEGYAKRHQKLGFQKYLDDAMAESNETIVGIEMCRDIYNFDKDICTKYARLGLALNRLPIPELRNGFRNLLPNIEPTLAIPICFVV